MVRLIWTTVYSSHYLSIECYLVSYICYTHHIALCNLPLHSAWINLEVVLGCDVDTTTLELWWCHG